MWQFILGIVVGGTVAFLVFAVMGAAGYDGAQEKWRDETADAENTDRGE